MSHSRESVRRQLRELAKLYGIQTSYRGMHNRRKTASMDALLETLRALKAPLDSLDDVPGALRERRLDLWRRTVEPITVAWDGRPPRIQLRLPANGAESSIRCHLTLESGEARKLVFDLSQCPAVGRATLEGEAFVAKELRLTERLPFGYHELRVESWSSRIVSAPRLAYAPISGRDRDWGVFLPLYALQSARSWGAGDFTDLEALLEWTAERGGGFVGTLPMLSAFLDEPLDPSPYSPVSRLFWNEIFIDPSRAPELQKSPEARALVESSEFQRELAAAQAAPLVDYRRLMSLKRQVLEPLSRSFPDLADASELQRFTETKPVADYARFRAAQEHRKEPWPNWPRALRNGSFTPRDYDERARQYHLYVQWTADRQIRDLEEKARDAGTGLYLDLPLGVHPHGFDVWREQDLFARSASVGAPPDPVFTTGQDWGFPPLHPEALREQGYRYPIAYLHHQMEHAKLLRIDHVMGLHRLFWIPQGVDASEGVYVSYQPEEQYALLSVESHRTGTGIVGENLGIVPGYVNRAMDRHGFYRMYVLQYSVSPSSPSVLQKVPAHAVASLNTHDTPPFEGFLQGDDVEALRSAHRLEEPELLEKQKERAIVTAALERFAAQQNLGDGQPSDLLTACLAFLAAGPARLVLVNLEDLWQERRPQNVPGFPGLNPNWQRKARLALEEFSGSEEVRAILSLVHSLRQSKRT